MSKLNKFMAFIVVIFSAFIFMQSETKACPLGFTSVPNQLVTVGDCQYYVDICVKCPTGPGPAEITFTGYTLVDPDCNNSLSMDEVYYGLKAAIMSYSFIHNLCTQINAPPCIQSQPVIFYWYNCLYKEKVQYFGEDHIVYYPCDLDTYCQVVKEYCWNGTTYLETTYSITQVGSPNCQWDTPPDPTQYNQPTSCFRLHTLCD